MFLTTTHLDERSATFNQRVLSQQELPRYQADLRMPERPLLLASAVLKGSVCSMRLTENSEAGLMRVK